jgi:hypothetical protein
LLYQFTIRVMKLNIVVTVVSFTQTVVQHQNLKVKSTHMPNYEGIININLDEIAQIIISCFFFAFVTYWKKN